MQQSPNQPQWQPPTQYPPYQQQYYQPPPYYPPPMMIVHPPPKRRSSCLVAVSVVILICVVIGAFNAIFNQPKITSTSINTLQPTNTPTIPTEAPSQYTTKPILGSDVSVFLAKYGQPDLNDSDVDYAYTSLGLVVMIDTGATKRISSIQRAPTDGSTWTVDQAKATCKPYMPSDAHFKHTLTIYGKHGIALDYEFVYFSSSLAKRLPASDFIDQNLKHDKPGTFVLGLSYKLGSTSAFDYCFVAASMQ